MRHVKIEEDDIGLQFACGTKKSVAIADGADDIKFRLEKEFERIGNKSVIVCEQNAWLSHEILPKGNYRAPCPPDKCK